MTDVQAPEIPEWIYPDAKVILLVDDHGQRDNPTFYRATVGKLAKLSFLVHFGEDREERINFKDLCSKDQGSSWNRWKYRVLNRDSIEVQRLREIRERNRSCQRMLDALRPIVEVNAGDKRDNLDLIREAVVALTRHGDLVHRQDTTNPVHRAASSTVTRCGKPVADHPHYVRHIDKGVTCAECKETIS